MPTQKRSISECSISANYPCCNYGNNISRFFKVWYSSRSIKYYYISSSSLSLTPEQKDAIRNPNNLASKLNPVNTTESKLCGIPKTVKPHMSNTTSATIPDTTTGAETPPSLPDTSIGPSAVP